MEELGVENLKKESKKINIDNSKKPVFLTGLMSIILIITFIFTLKTYEPTKNILIMGSVFVYPLTFLIVAYITKYYGFKEARRSIFTSSLLYLVFMLLMIICIIPHSNNITAGYNAVVQYVFTNNLIEITDNFYFFYPMLGQFFSVVIAFLVSHILYSTIYTAIKNYTIDYLSVGLSLFIAYIVDRLIYMPILFAEGLIKGSNTFNYFITCLTSEFIVAIISCILILVVFVIISSVKKRLKNN